MMRSGSFSFCFRWLLLLGILLFAVDAMTSAQEDTPAEEPPVTEASAGEKKAAEEAARKKEEEERISR